MKLVMAPSPAWLLRSRMSHLGARHGSRVFLYVYIDCIVPSQCKYKRVCRTETSEDEVERYFESGL